MPAKININGALPDTGGGPRAASVRESALASPLPWLIARIAAGEQPALAELYDHPAATLFGLARLIVGDAQDAEEVLCAQVRPRLSMASCANVTPSWPVRFWPRERRKFPSRLPTEGRPGIASGRRRSASFGNSSPSRAIEGAAEAVGAGRLTRRASSR